MSQPPTPTLSSLVKTDSEVRDLPDTLVPIKGQGVSRDAYTYPVDTTVPKVGSPGAGINIASETMPVEGMFEVHDSDDEIRESTCAYADKAGLEKGQP